MGSELVSNIWGVVDNKVYPVQKTNNLGFEKSDLSYTREYKTGKKWINSTWKDGHQINSKCYDEDGNNKDCNGMKIFWPI